MPRLSIPEMSGFSAAPAASRRLLLFELAAETYAVPISCVQELTFMAELSHPAGCPAILRGFLDVGGAAVPVVDLRRVLGLDVVEPSLHTPLILLRGASMPLALLVDRLSREVTVPDKDTRPVAAGDSLNGCIECETTVERRAVHVLSVPNLLLEKERLCLEDLRLREQLRLDALRAEAARPVDFA